MNNFFSKTGAVCLFTAESDVTNEHNSRPKSLSSDILLLEFKIFVADVCLKIILYFRYCIERRASGPQPPCRIRQRVFRALELIRRTERGITGLQIVWHDILLT
jgi:hypothetical protein